MKTTYYLPLLFILTAGFLFSCSDKSNPVGPGGGDNGGGQTQSGYNQSDTTVTLKNGLLTIGIPTGAMKKGTKVGLSSSSVRFVDTAHVLHQFQLLPEGTTFKKPVTLTFHYDSAWLKGNSPWNIGIAYKDDEDGHWYAAINGNMDTVKHTISIKTKHFSHWTIYNCFHLYMQYGGQFSRDDLKAIKMKESTKAFLLVNMTEPPAWKNDPDKSILFGNPLVASLEQHKIDPEEDYQRAIKPDVWTVNSVPNGNSTVGIISFKGGASDALYEYDAPDHVDGTKNIGILAQVKVAGQVNIPLIQEVEINGKAQWKIDLQTTYVDNEIDVKLTTKSRATIYMHIKQKHAMILDSVTNVGDVTTVSFSSTYTSYKVTYKDPIYGIPVPVILNDGAFGIFNPRKNRFHFHIPIASKYDTRIDSYCFNDKDDDGNVGCYTDKSEPDLPFNPGDTDAMGYPAKDRYSVVYKDTTYSYGLGRGSMSIKAKLTLTKLK